MPRWKNCMAFCAPIAPTTTSSTSVSSVGGWFKQFGAQFFADQIHGRIRQNLFVRQHAEQVQPFAFQPAADEPRDFGNFFLMHLVDDDADDFDAFFFKQRLIQADFVNRFADAALGNDDDFAAERFGDLRVGQIKHRTDASVAAAFAQNKIFFPRDAVEGMSEFF